MPVRRIHDSGDFCNGCVVIVIRVLANEKSKAKGTHCIMDGYIFATNLAEAMTKAELRRKKRMGAP